QPGDAVWCPLKIPEEFWERTASYGLPLVNTFTDVRDVPEGLELVPWGWTESIRRFARTVHAGVEAPPDAAIVKSNSRRCSHDLESRWNCGLDGAVPITSPADLERALRHVGPSDRWVLKAEFSSAARQRIVCTGPTPDGNSAGWIRNRSNAGEWLLFEPWV